MKRLTLFISGVALLGFSQYVHSITLDNDEVTVIIEGEAEYDNISNKNKEQVKKRYTPFDPNIPLMLNDTIQQLTSPKPKATDHEKKLTFDTPQIKKPNITKKDESPPTSYFTDLTSPVPSAFPSGEVIILNHDDELLPGTDLETHTYLGNWMGATSESINR